MLQRFVSSAPPNHEQQDTQSPANDAPQQNTDQPLSLGPAPATATPPPVTSTIGPISGPTANEEFRRSTAPTSGPSSASSTSAPLVLPPVGSDFEGYGTAPDEGGGGGSDERTAAPTAIFRSDAPTVAPATSRLTTPPPALFQTQAPTTGGGGARGVSSAPTSSPTQGSVRDIPPAGGDSLPTPAPTSLGESQWVWWSQLGGEGADTGHALVRGVAEYADNVYLVGAEESTVDSTCERGRDSCTFRCVVWVRGPASR